MTHDLDTEERFRLVDWRLLTPEEARLLGHIDAVLDDIDAALQWQERAIFRSFHRHNGQDVSHWIN